MHLACTRTAHATWDRAQTRARLHAPLLAFRFVRLVHFESTCDALTHAQISQFFVFFSIAEYCVCNYLFRVEKLINDTWAKKKAEHAEAFDQMKQQMQIADLVMAHAHRRPAPLSLPAADQQAEWT